MHFNDRGGWVVSAATADAQPEVRSTHGTIDSVAFSSTGVAGEVRAVTNASIMDAGGALGISISMPNWSRTIWHHVCLPDRSGIVFTVMWL